MGLADKTIEEADNTIKESKDRYVEELDKKILEQQEEIQKQIEKLAKSTTLLESETPPREALDEASKIRKAVDRAVEKLDHSNRQRDILGIPYEPCKLIEEFNQKFDLRHRLWQIRQTFSEDRKKWYKGFFKDNDAEGIVKTVSDRVTELVKMKLQLGGSDSQD